MVSVKLFCLDVNVRCSLNLNQSFLVNKIVLKCLLVTVGEASLTAASHRPTRESFANIEIPRQRGYAAAVALASQIGIGLIPYYNANFQLFIELVDFVEMTNIYLVRHTQ